LVSKIPPDLGYEYVSIGQMIRDEINKKTNYSKLIMENLEKDKKINEKILDILLKNATLVGNFVIKCNAESTQTLRLMRIKRTFGRSSSVRPTCIWSSSSMRRLRKAWRRVCVA
jgi:hypothetical protein